MCITKTKMMEDPIEEHQTEVRRLKHQTASLSTKLMPSKLGLNIISKISSINTIITPTNMENLKFRIILSTLLLVRLLH